MQDESGEAVRDRCVDDREVLGVCLAFQTGQQFAQLRQRSGKGAPVEGFLRGFRGNVGHLPQLFLLFRKSTGGRNGVVQVVQQFG